MSDRAFVDTNVLVYLFDRDAPAKRRRAREIIVELGPRLILSTQVLQEFYVSVTSKLATPLSPAEAEAAVRDLVALDTVGVDVALILAAIVTSRRRRTSFWDALIIEAARSRGCQRLLSEDLQPGGTFGDLRVENPFADL